MPFIGNYPAETQTVDLKWQPIKTASFTAVAGEGYWINTTSGAVTVTLPSSANTGDTIEFSDYARTWGTNNVTLNRNGLNYQGGTENAIYDTNGQSVRIVYSGATQGWIPTSDDDVSDEANPPITAEYLVVAGGGSGSGGNGGGGGAGGYLTNYGTGTITLTSGEVYTATVGAGGAGVSGIAKVQGNDGSDSSLSGAGISTVTALGGGGAAPENGTGSNGGSGGGGGSGSPSGTPPGGSGTVGQGNDGGDGNGPPSYTGGGGGGAGEAGNTDSATDGGDGLSNSITGSAIFYAGGGGGGGNNNGTGGDGGGTDGNNTSPSGSASSPANTGGGTGGVNDYPSGNGGSGVVILRLATSQYSGTTTGSPTVTTDGSDTVIKFTSSGSYTA
jgi:hypothetical protein